MTEEQTRPDYYNVNGPYEVHRVQEAWGTHDSSHYIAAAIEYLARWDKKGEPASNLKKAMYLIYKEWCRQTYGVDGHGVTIMGSLPDFGVSDSTSLCDSKYFPATAEEPVKCWLPKNHEGIHKGADIDGRAVDWNLP